MGQSKRWYESKTVWGGAIAITAGVAGAFGYMIDLQLQTELTNVVASIGGAVGGMVAIWGRFQATKTISER